MQNKHEGMAKGFYWHSQAGYDTRHLPRGVVDEINFGYFDVQEGQYVGGTTGEMMMEWHQLGTREGPSARLCCFYDGWTALATFTDLIARLGELDDKNITPEQFAALLVELGFTDLTEREER